MNHPKPPPRQRERAPQSERTGMLLALNRTHGRGNVFEPHPALYAPAVIARRRAEHLRFKAARKVHRAA